MFSPIESLEARVLLSHAMLETQVFYPEGFAHAGVTEVVSISNTGDLASEFELIAHYERGERDQLLIEGSLEAGESQEFTLAGDGIMLVRPHEPFALELRSEGDLGALLRHDDFGGAAAGQFSKRVSDHWAFPDVAKNSESHDFIVFYNPASEDVTVLVTGFDANGKAFELASTIGAHRRGGWNLRGEMSVPDGTFGVSVTSTLPVVAGLSHYRPAKGESLTQLGSADGGAVAGVVFDVEFSERGRGLGNGVTPPGQANKPVSDTTIGIFNSGDNAATVDLVFLNRDESDPLTNNRRSVQVDAGERFAFDLAAMNFPDEADIALVYESDEPVTVGARVTQKNKSFRVTSAIAAATQWEFANPALNQIQNGIKRSDELYVFNPTNRVVDVKIDFYRANGEMRTQTVQLEPLEFREIDATVLPPNPGEGRPFHRISVSSRIPVSVGLEYWARENKDVFSLRGFASGDIVRLSEVLVLD